MKVKETTWPLHGGGCKVMRYIPYQLEIQVFVGRNFMNQHTYIIDPKMHNVSTEPLLNVHVWGH